MGAAAIDSVRAVGNLDRLDEAIAQRSGDGGGVATVAAEADSRHRPHALGDARPRQRAERASALRHPGPRPRRRQRDRRELPRAARAPQGRRRRLHVRDRRRGDRAPRRACTTTATWSRPCGCAYNDLEGHFAFVAMSLDAPEHARRRAQGMPADRRDRRRRGVPGLRRARRSWRRRAACSSSRTARSSPSAPGTTRFISPDGERDRAPGLGRRLGRGHRREGRLRDVHAQGDPRAGGRRRRDDRRPHDPRGRRRPRRRRRAQRRAAARRAADRRSSPAAPRTTPA